MSSSSSNSKKVKDIILNLENLIKFVDGVCNKVEDEQEFVEKLPETLTNIFGSSLQGPSNISSELVLSIALFHFLLFIIYIYYLK